MIKKIILYKGGIETLQYFSYELNEAFEKMGYETFFFDLGSEYDSFLNLMEFVDPGETASVGFNFNGCSGEECMYDKFGIHFYDFKNVPMINIVVDHPFYYHKFLPYLPKNYTQVSIDLEHEDYIKRFFPEIKRGPFIPLAGSVYEPKAWEEKSIDVVFTGNYNPPEKHEKTLGRNGKEYYDFYHDLLDDIIANPHLEMTTAIEKHIMDNFDEADEESLKDTFPYMIIIDLYIRHYFRGEAVKALVDGGVKVNVYGSGWRELKCAHPENMIVHDVTDTRTCLQAISDAKVSLNVMPWFKRGAHDRVFSSMLNNAVCVTDPSQYLNQVLTDKKDVLFYDLKDMGTLPDMVGDILADRSRWEEMTDAAYKNAINEHTWKQRAKRIDAEILKRM